MVMGFAPLDAARLFFHPSSLEIHNIKYEDDDDFVDLPILFVKRFYETIPEDVVFTDPIGNQFYLVAVKHRGEMILGGWRQVVHFYGLTVGGHVRIIYVGQGHFFIQVFNTEAHEVFYPPLPVPVPISSSSDDLVSLSNEEANIIDEEDYNLLYMHTITTDDMGKNVLALPYEFCIRAFPFRSCAVNLIEGKGGRNWNYFLNIETGHRGYCALTGQWAHFRNQNRVKEGDKILFGVKKLKATDIYYVQKD